MHLIEIDLCNYRNYQHLCFQPAPCINYIYGENAQGKTNFIESVYYLLGAHSYKTRNERELTRWGDSNFRVKGKVYFENDKTVNLSVYYSSPSEKKIKVNGREVNREEYISMFPVVIFHPEDLLMIKEGPVLRRKFLNREITRIYPLYWKYLQQFYRVLNHRNSLLKKYPVNLKDLETWDDSLIYYAGKIIYLRMVFLNKLQQHFFNTHQELTSRKEDINLHYNSSVDLDRDLNYTSRERSDVEKEINEKLKRKIMNLQNEEIKRGYTLTGPQVEDFTLYINQRNIKRYASQGQQRTAILSIKLSLYSLLEENNKKAILLLDDVFSELDEKRREAVINFIERKQLQCFITGFEKSIIPKKENLPLSVFNLRNGVLVYEKSR